MIKETITFTFDNEAQQRRFHARLKGQPWVCGARKQGTSGGNDPADCDWPFCGCDHDAEEVVSTLREAGWKSPDELNEYARKVREQAFREAAADKDD